MNNLINNLITTFNSLGGGFCDYAVNMFVQTAVLIALLLIVDFLVRKRVRATLRYWIWMLVFIKLILPPSLSLPTGVGYWFGDYLSTDSVVSEGPSNNALPEPVAAPVSEHRVMTAEIPQIQPPQINPEPAAPATPAFSNFQALTWQATVFILWLIGAAVLSVLLIHRMLFVRKLIAQSEPSKNRYAEILDQCRQQLGIKRIIELRLSGKLQSPAVCGLFRPVILMPAGLLDRLSTDKLRAVLIHELAHIKRGDLWINCVQTFLQIAYFYNPFVWLANAVVRRIREQAVDEMVLVALGAGAKSYSNTLIDIAEMSFFKTSLSLRLIGVVESKKSLEGRIKHMLNRPIPKSAKIGIAGLLIIIIAGAVLLPMAKAKENQKLLKGIDEKLKVTDKAGELTINSLYMPSPNGKSLVGTNKVTMYIDVTNNSEKDLYLGLEYYTDSGTIVKVFSPGATSLAQIKKVPANWQGKLEYPIYYNRFVKGGYVKITLARCAVKENMKDTKLAFLPTDSETLHEKKYFIASREDAESDGTAARNSVFTATLPNGVTVELVGLCEGPDTNGRQWWRPDGANMPEPSYQASKRVPPFASIPTQYIFMAKATGGKDVSLQMRIYEGTGLSTRAASDGTALCYVRHNDPEKAYHKDAFVKGPVEIGAADGQWLRARGVNSDIQNPRSYLIGSHDQIVIQTPQPEKSSPEMATFFWATASSHDYEFRLKCTLKSGKAEEVMRPNFQHTEAIETKDTSRSILAQTSFNIDQPLNQIADYELLYRKFEYVRFNNVTFKPGLKTEVQVGFKPPELQKKEVVKAKKDNPDMQIPDVKSYIILQANVFTMKVTLLSINEFLQNQLDIQAPMGELTDMQAERFRQWAASIPGTNIFTGPKSIVFDGHSSKMSMTNLTEYTLDYVKDANSLSGYEPKHEEIMAGVEIEFIPTLSNDNKLIRLGLNITKSDVFEIEKKTHESGNEVQLPGISRRKVSTQVAIPAGIYFLTFLGGINGILQFGNNVQPAESEEHTILLIKAEVKGKAGGEKAVL